MAFKLRTDDIMIWLLLMMQLGFHTNTGYDDVVSLGVSVLIFLYFIVVGGKTGFVRLTQRGKEYFIWYSAVTFICSISALWATHSNMSSILSLIVDTYIPIVISLMCVAEYLKRGNTGLGMMTALVMAEVAVAIRALLNTEFTSLLSEYNTRLYGRGLGVNYNHFTTQFALVLCVVLFLAYYVHKAFYIPALFIIANIIISGSRKVLLVSVFVFVFLYLTSSGSSLWKKLLRLLVVVAVLGAALWIISTNSFLNQLIGKKTMLVVREVISMDVDRSSDFSAYQRSELIKKAGEVFFSHPILGVGYYCFRNYNEWNLYAHNNYMELLADMGIVGFLTYYSMYIRCFLEYIHMHIRLRGGKLRLNHRKEPSKWNKLGVLFILSLLFIEYGQVTFFRPYVLIPIMVTVLGIENMKNGEAWKRRA